MAIQSHLITFRLEKFGIGRITALVYIGDAILVSMKPVVIAIFSSWEICDLVFTLRLCSFTLPKAPTQDHYSGFYVTGKCPATNGTFRIDAMVKLSYLFLPIIPIYDTEH